MSVLVIEDDVDLAGEIVSFLRRRGYGVATCASLTACGAFLEAALRNSAAPDVIICDLSLADGDGLELYISFAARMPATHWLVMTGYHDVEQIQQRLASSRLAMPLVVEKPVSLRTLERAIREASAKSDQSQTRDV